MAQVVDLEMEQGATFLFPFVLHEPLFDEDGNLDLDEDGNVQAGDPRDLTGCTLRMQIRPRVKSATVWVTATSDSLEDEPEIGGRLVIGDDPTDGEVFIQLTDLDTMKVTKTKAVYDIELIHPEEDGEVRPFVERVLMGSIANTLNVTRYPEEALADG